MGLLNLTVIPPPPSPHPPPPTAGEIGLGGEIRPVAQLERRLAEAAKLGFRQFLVPSGSSVAAKGRLEGVRVTECRRVLDAFRAALGTGGAGS